MSSNDEEILRSQYSNVLGATGVAPASSEKEEKKQDEVITRINNRILQENQEKTDSRQKNHLYFAEQDVESGYDALNGVLDNPSNIDLIDGLIDSDEEKAFYDDFFNPKERRQVDPEDRHSVIEALEKKKEIVALREQEHMNRELEQKEHSNEVNL